MRWSSQLTRGALTAAWMAVTASAFAAPPPPGWDQRARLAACGPDPRPVVTTPIAATVAPAPEVRLSRTAPGVRLAWAARLHAPARAIGRVVGLAYDVQLGLIAVTDKAAWLVFDLARLPEATTTTIRAAPMLGAPGAPAAASPIIFRQILVAFNDARRVDAYDLNWCGLAAIPQPNLSLADGDTITAIGTLDPSMINQPDLLFLGARAGRAAQLATELRTGVDQLRFGPDFLPPRSGDRLLGATGLDTSDGCNAVALLQPERALRRTVLKAFCSPDFSPTQEVAHGDVGWRVKRLGGPKPGVILARVSVPLIAIASVGGTRTTLEELGIAQDGPAGDLVLVDFEVPAARYDDRPPQPPGGR